MLIKGNVLPDEQNKMETSRLSSTKIVVYYSKLTKICLERRIERIKRISFYTKIIKKLAKNSQKLQKSLPKLQNILHMCNICSNFAVAFSEGKQVRFLHSPAAVIRNPMFIILKVTGWNSWRSKVEGQLYAGKAEYEER